MLGQDGASVAGVPIGGGARLVGWGGLTTIADTIKELKLATQDQLDTANGEDIVTGGAAAGIIHQHDYLSFARGARNISMAQNTAGANNVGYTLDVYPGGPVGQHTYYGVDGKNWKGSTVFSGALTALTWKSQAFAPSPAMPAGKYAIQGVIVSSLTNYALVRFQHADFGAFLPGVPVVDPNAAIARAVAPGYGQDLLVDNCGYQFTYLSQVFSTPMEPIFTVQANATGLNVQVASITGDTPEFILNLIQVG